jgi:DNA-binding CsgD family transcriptional regulator
MTQSKTRIPAGINKTDERCEIYAHNNEVHGTYKGKSLSFEELPVKIRDYYTQEYFDDVEAQQSIKEDMGVIGFKRALYTYILCNHGGFDFEPDYDPAVCEIKKEYWQCGKRFQCASEGKVCKPWIMTHYNLSVREIEVIKHIAEGLTDAEIGAEMFLATTTIQTHSRNVKLKLGMHSRSAITSFAKENNIL